MLFAPSLFWLWLRCLFGSSIFVMVVLAGSLGFLMIWSLMICSSVMWSTCLGFLCFCGWKTICCLWLNSFLIVMLLKLKSEFVEVSIVVCDKSAFACWLFCSHDVKHSWFFAAENANLSIDSILRKQVAQIFFGSKSSSSTLKRDKKRSQKELHKNRFGTDMGLRHVWCHFDSFWLREWDGKIPSRILWYQPKLTSPVHFRHPNFKPAATF